MGVARLSFRDYWYTYYVAGFERTAALKGVSVCQIEPSEIVAIVGPNGAGKSTLLEAILGTLPGRLRAGDVDVEWESGEPHSRSLRFSYVPQKPYEGLVFDLSVLENIILKSVFHAGVSLRRAVTPASRQRVVELFKELGFESLIPKLDMPPGTLSGGQQQLVNVIGAAYASADVILCDEPTSKLDEQNRIRVANLLVELAHRFKSRVVFATHDHHLAERLADRIVSLEEGEVKQERSLREPGSRRWVGAIRLAKTRKELPEKFRDLKPNWWGAGVDGVFGDDYFRGDDSISGYLSNYPLTREGRTRREVDGALRLTGVGGNKSALMADVPCGWGRHAIEFAARGWSVVGVDLCSEYLELAKRAANDAKLTNVRFSEGDMRQLPLDDNSCDVLVNLWTSFGYFDHDDNVKALREFARVLKPNGTVLIHTDHNPERVRLGIFDEPPVRQLCRGGYLEVTECYCEEDASVYGVWNVQPDGREHLYKIGVYGVRAWQEMARDCGLTVKGFWGGLDERDGALSERSQEFVAVLSKA